MIRLVSRVGVAGSAGKDWTGEATAIRSMTRKADEARIRQEIDRKVDVAGYGYYVDHQLASGQFNVGMLRQRTEHTCAGSGAVPTAVYAVKRLALKRCAAHQRRPHFRQTRPISR